MALSTGATRQQQAKIKALCTGDDAKSASAISKLLNVEVKCVQSFVESFKPAKSAAEASKK